MFLCLYVCCCCFIDICLEKDEDGEIDAPICENLMEEYKPYKNDAAAQALNVENAIREYNEAFELLKTKLGEVKKWRYGCDLALKESEVQVALDDYNQKYALLQDFKQCLCSIGEEERQKAKKR